MTGEKEEEAMMKKEKRFCMVAENRMMSDFSAIDEDLLAFEEDHDQRVLLRKMARLRRMKSYLQFLLVYGLLISSMIFMVTPAGTAQTSNNPFGLAFNGLNPKYLPEGILHNRSPYYYRCFSFDTISYMLMPDTMYKASPYLYQGGNINMGPDIFLKLYRDMLFSQIHDSVIINPDDYYDNLRLARTTYDIPISLMAVQFRRMNEDALSSGKAWFDTLQEAIYPMPDTLKLPDSLVTADTIVFTDSTLFIVFNNHDSLLSLAFEKHRLFGYNIPDDWIYADGSSFTLRYGLPSGLLISNDPALPEVKVDFSDGLGYRNIPWDVPLDITYQRPSSPRLQTLDIHIKIPSIDPDMVMTHTINVVVNAIHPDTVIMTQDIPSSCNTASGNTPGEGMLSILYADKQLKKIIKPVLFIEGFETSLKDYGDITFMHVVNGVMPSLGFPEIGDLPLLFDSLTALGYDLIYLDFKNARDTIEKNMLSVIRTITWLNDALTAVGSPEKLVVAGASLGGILARYALRQMELDGCCHNTRLYISFDAPHRGANIPMGMQKLVEVAAQSSASWKNVSWPLSWISSFSNLTISLANPDIEESWDLVLNSPAAKALLIQHVTPGANLVHQQFYDQLDSIGYPVYCRKVALINGSENGINHQLDDTAERLMGTGYFVKPPYAWIVLPHGLNHTTVPLWFPALFSNYPIAYSTASAESQPFYFEHNNWSQSIHNLNKILNRSLWQTMLHSHLGASASATAVFAPVLSYFLETALIVSKHSGNHALHDIHDQATTLTQFPSSGLQNLTSAPGGLNNSIKKLEDAASGNIEVYSSAFSFIPSVSALDIKTPLLNLDIKYQYLANPSELILFDAYWAPRRSETGDFIENQLHVQVTPKNRDWIIDHLQTDWDMRSATGRYQGVLTTAYNYGKPGALADINYYNRPFNSVLYSLDIMAGGCLYVNRQGEIGFPDGISVTQPASTFRLTTMGDSCDPSHVRIFDGGSIVLGDPLNHNKAIVSFHKNTVLEILSGGQLTINDHSRLIMEDGATLIIHPGAEIILAGSDAVLEIGGKLMLHDNTRFTFTGTGYLKYNTPMVVSNHTDYFLIGNNADIFLEGSGINEKKLEIAADTWFPYNLKVHVKDALVTLDQDESLHLFGETILMNTWFRATDTTVLYRAVNLYGQPGVMVEGCTFSHGTTGLKACLGLGGSSLSLVRCNFRNNICGLHSMDEKVRLLECNISNNLQYGWLAENMAGKSLTEDCLFTGNSHAGISFDGQLSASLLIRNSKLSSNLYGLKIFHAMLQSECSHYINNGYTGILGGAMSQIMLGGMGRNQITDNFIGLALDQALDVNLENGFIRFSGNMYYIIGEVLHNHYYDLPTNSILSIDLSGNHMPVSGNSLPVYIYFFHPVTQQLTQVGILASTMASVQQTTCATIAHANEHITKPLEIFHGVAVVDGGRYHNWMLVDALHQAANHVSCEGYAGNDTLAIACFADALNHIPSVLSEEEWLAVDYALQLMTVALGNAIEGGYIDANRALEGMPVDQYVEMIAQRVQNRMTQVDPGEQDSDELKARYALMMAQMFRVAEHYDYAMQILDNGNHFTNTSLSGTAAYWSCVCQAERLLLLDSIDKGHFSSRMDSCNTHHNARLLPFIPHFGHTEITAPILQNNPVKLICPNPARHSILISFHGSVRTLSTELFDISGKLVFQHDQEWCGSKTILRLPDLPPGYYCLKINADDNTSMHKVIIQQE